MSDELSNVRIIFKRIDTPVCLSVERLVEELAGVFLGVLRGLSDGCDIPLRHGRENSASLLGGLGKQI